MCVESVLSLILQSLLKSTYLRQKLTLCSNSYGKIFIQTAHTDLNKLVKLVQSAASDSRTHSFMTSVGHLPTVLVSIWGFVPSADRVRATVEVIEVSLTPLSYTNLTSTGQLQYTWVNSQKEWEISESVTQQIHGR